MILTISGELLDFGLVFTGAVHVELVADVVDEVVELGSVLISSVVLRDVSIHPSSDVLRNLEINFIIGVDKSFAYRFESFVRVHLSDILGKGEGGKSGENFHFYQMFFLVGYLSNCL